MHLLHDKKLRIRPLPLECALKNISLEHFHERSFILFLKRKECKILNKGMVFVFENDARAKCLIIKLGPVSPVQGWIFIPSEQASLVSSSYSPKVDIMCKFICCIVDKTLRMQI